MTVRTKIHDKYYTYVTNKNPASTGSSILPRSSAIKANYSCEQPSAEKVEVKQLRPHFGDLCCLYIRADAIPKKLLQHCIVCVGMYVLLVYVLFGGHP